MSNTFISTSLQAPFLGLCPLELGSTTRILTLNSLLAQLSGLSFTLSTLSHLIKCLPFTSLNLFFSPLLATSSRKKSVCTTVHLFSQLLVPSKAHSLLRITPISTREEGAFPIQRTMTYRSKDNVCKCKVRGEGLRGLTTG